MSPASGDKKGVLRAVVFFVIFCVNTAEEVVLRASPELGNVQIFEDNVWKDLQSSDLDIPDLKVLCRSLGQPADFVNRLDDTPQPTGGAASTAISVALNCTGNETNIKECETTYSQISGENDHPITLSCEGLKFHLYGGGPKDGLVMVTIGNDSLPLCVHPHFNGTMAGLMCKSMGLNWTFPLIMYPRKYSYRTIKNALELELTCSGNGSDCDIHTTNRNEMCYKRNGIYDFKIAAVFCSDQAPEYRLTTLPGESIPRLDVKINETWGPVCADGGNEEVAETICRNKGLPSTNARYYGDLFSGGDFDNGYVEMNTCSLDDSGNTCSFGKPCEGESYLGLTCEDATEGQVRLWSRSSFEGTVQVYHNGTWRGVGVNPSKTDLAQEAKVVCRSANLPTNATQVKRVSTRTQTLWLNNLDCQGDENSILNCSDTPLDQITSATFGFPLEVECGADDEAIRLEEDGLLMIRRNGRWGTVCADRLRDVEVTVLCKELNQPSFLAWTSRGSNRPTRTGTIWREEFRCSSTLANWKTCVGLPFYSRECTHYGDAYLTCRELNVTEYRLADSPVPHAGFVQMLVNNTWGGLCDSLFGSNEAEVICRTLGMRTDGAKRFSSKLLGTPQTDKVWLNEINCPLGTEASLLDCQHRYNKNDRCVNRDDGPLAVWCGAPDPPEDFNVRLVRDSDTEPGRVEVSLFGEWGTICDKNFDDNAAKMVCRKLGLPREIAMVAEKGTYENGTGRIWLTNVNCWENDYKLDSCDYKLANGSCDHGQDVGVVCKDNPRPTRPSPSNDPSIKAPVGVIVGAIFGSVVGLVVLVALGVLLVKQRQISSAGKAAVTLQTVQYVVSPGNGALPTNGYPQPCAGSVPQYGKLK